MKLNILNTSIAENFDKTIRSDFLNSLSFVLLKILDATMGLRVAQEDEQRGLDLSEHGEEGYIFN